MTYPLKFREKVLEVRAREGLTIAQVAARFDVGVASVVRWLKSPVLKARRNKKATRIDMAALERDGREHPDAFQYERAARFDVSRRGIAQALRRLGVTYKKTLAHPKANEDERRSFQARIKAHEAAGRPIVYIDESGFAANMPRTHGYAPKGKRCFGRHNWRAAGRTNVIGALLAGLLLTTLLCDFNIDGDIFHEWITHELIRHCCKSGHGDELSPFPEPLGDALDLGLAEGVEAVHDGDADLDFGGLAVGVT